jgi:SAM-dependent methyltransferase
VSDERADDLDPVRAYWEWRASHAAKDDERIESGGRAQRMRFEVFLRVHDVRGCSLLDVGCGVGDFYGRLMGSGVECRYHGVDLAPAMIARARERFPLGMFELRDIVAQPPPRMFDYTVAFAIHNVRVPNGRTIMEQTLRRQFELASRAAHMSLLTDRYAGFDAHIQPWRAEDILELALSVSPYVALRHDYLPHDFSVTLYRQPLIDARPELVED